MATYPPYIPTKDAQFLTWLENFDTLATAAPATYGLTAPDAVAIAAAAGLFIASYPISQDPATRTPVTVQQKDNDRATAEAVIRPYAVAISRNVNVLDADKVAIGVTVPSTVPTPIPAPIDAPELSIASMTPGLGKLFYKTVGAVGKAKPFGVVGVEVFAFIGDTHTTNPADASFVAHYTKSPFRMTFSALDAGKRVSIFARFVTRSGPAGVSQTGPWSAPLQTVIV